MEDTKLSELVDATNSIADISYELKDFEGTDDVHSESENEEQNVENVDENQYSNIKEFEKSYHESVEKYFKKQN